MGIVGSPVLSAGGGGDGISDIKDAYVLANSGADIVAADSPYTITSPGSVIAYVDTTAGPVTINPISSPSLNDRLKVVDVGGNAGTNNISITGLDSIKNDRGSREYRYNNLSFELIDASGSFEIVGDANSVPALNSQYDPADYGGSWALVGTTDFNDEDGLYLSNGTTWNKKLNDSDFIIGPRSDLFDYDLSTVGYSSTDELANVNNANTIRTNGSFAPVSNFFDTNDSSYNSTTQSWSVGDWVGREVALMSLGKIRLLIANASYNTTENSFSFQGLTVDGDWNNPTSWINLTPSSFNVVSGGNLNNDWQISGNILDNSPRTSIGSILYDIDVIFNSLTEYYGYRITLESTYNANSTSLYSFEGYKRSGLISPNTKIVNSINKVYNGESRLNATPLTSPTTLTNEDKTILLDSSGGNFTMTLPSVASVNVGKEYEFKMVAGSNTVTIEGDGSETIDGAATNSTALTAQWDYLRLKNDGTQWLIL